MYAQAVGSCSKSFTLLSYKVGIYLHHKDGETEAGRWRNFLLLRMIPTDLGGTRKPWRQQLRMSIRTGRLVLRDTPNYLPTSLPKTLGSGLASRAWERLAAVQHSIKVGFGLIFFPLHLPLRCHWAG